MELSSTTRTWSGSLVGEPPEARAKPLFLRAASGLGLAALYGLALGARAGGESFLWHAMGVPLGAIAVALVAAPAVFILLLLFGAPIEAGRLAAEVSRALSVFGIVLAGFAPAAALFAVTSGADVTAAVVASVGLAVAGALALGRLTSALADELSASDTATSLLGRLVSGGFVVLSIALAARVWAVSLPLLGGAS